MVARLQMDNEYKITTLLIYLFQTIESETISNHMHCTGLHQIQIPTENLTGTLSSSPYQLGLGR